MGKHPIGRLTAVALLLAAAAGCHTCLHRDADEATPPELQLCQALPQPCKNKVYVFFLHGFGPLGACYLDDLRDDVIAQGFIKAYIGWPHHVGYFQNELCRLREEEPLARFVLIGQHAGAARAVELAAAADFATVPIDLVVCIDGQTAGMHAPARVVHIRSARHVDEGACDGEVHRVDVGSGKVCTHPATVAILARELAEVAQRVPIISVLAPAPPPTGLTPRVLPPPTPTSRDEWDFLRPDDSPAGAPGARPLDDAAAAPPATLRHP